MLRRLLRLCVSVCYYALEALSFGPVRALSGRSRTRLTVLTYHQVSDAQKPAFDRQIAVMQRFGTPVFADQKTDGRSRGRFVAVTFDDFLSDALRVAGDALSRAGIPSTWFVVTGAMGGKVNWIRDSQFQNRAADVGSVEDLQGLDRNLFRCGSHTQRHADLTKLAPEELDGEIRQSRSELEAVSGRPVVTLSLPYGEYDNSVLRRCKDAGYKILFANVPVWGAFSHGDFLRGRVPVEPSDWPLEFWLKLRGGYDWLAVPGWLRHQVFPSLRGSARKSKSGAAASLKTELRRG